MTRTEHKTKVTEDNKRPDECTTIIKLLTDQQYHYSNIICPQLRIGAAERFIRFFKYQHRSRCWGKKNNDWHVSRQVLIFGTGQVTLVLHTWREYASPRFSGT